MEMLLHSEIALELSEFRQFEELQGYMVEMKTQLWKRFTMSTVSDGVSFCSCLWNS